MPGDVPLKIAERAAAEEAYVHMRNKYSSIKGEPGRAFMYQTAGSAGFFHAQNPERTANT